MTGPHLTWVPHPVDRAALDLLTCAGPVVLGYGEHARRYEDVAHDVTGVLLRTAHFGADHVAAAPRLRVIARHGVGTDTVDLDAATRAGVPVTVTADANAQSVAEHVLALLLAVARHVVTATTEVRFGGWDRARRELVGVELAGRRLGLLGCGRIGRRVVTLAQAFGMEVLAHDPGLDDREAADLGVRPVGLDTLLRSSDVLSLHAPLLPSTRGVLGHDALALLPRGAIVVNTSRGGLVDHDALAEHIASGRLGGAGLDVTDPEPLPDGHPLLSMPTVVLTPHVGGQTADSMRRVAVQAATSVLDAYAGRPLQHVVNEI